tara:strand:- start:213 stop:476 length:264 start_codon:yes stop_codon:yes gene_type:complete
MFLCVLCEKEHVYTSSLCDNCRVIKHLMTTYSPERVCDVLDKVLRRTEEKQEIKIQEEIKKEKEKLEERIETKIITRSKKNQKEEKD